MLDEDSLKQLNELKVRKLPKKLQGGLIHRYTVNWKSGGIDPTHDEHKEYLDKFCDDFIESMKSLIQESWKSDEKQKMQD